MDLPVQWEGWKHHHWLLIRLALKTGNVTKIWSAYGEGGLAGLMGLSEEVHSPGELYVPRVCCITAGVVVFFLPGVFVHFLVTSFTARLPTVTYRPL